MNDDQSIEALRLSLEERSRIEASEPSAEELMILLEITKKGTNPALSRSFMVIALRQLREGNRTIFPLIENWVIHAFGKIIDDKESADVAFGLTTGKGKRARPDTHDRDILIAAHVILDMRDNKKWDCAIGDAANLFFPDGKGDKAAEAAYSKYKDILGMLPDETLRGLIGD